MRRGVRHMSRLTVLLMVSALLAGSIQAVVAAEPSRRVDPSRLQLTPVQPRQIGGVLSGDFSKAASKDGRIAVIVKLANDSVAAYRGGVKGFAATNPAARGRKTINLTATDTVRYRAYLKTRRDAFVTRLKAKVDGVKVTGRFDLVLNAVAVVIPADQLKRRRQAARRRDGLSGRDPQDPDRHLPGFHRGTDRLV